MRFSFVFPHFRKKCLFLYFSYFVFIYCFCFLLSLQPFFLLSNFFLQRSVKNVLVLIFLKDFLKGFVSYIIFFNCNFFKDILSYIVFSCWVFVLKGIFLLVIFRFRLSILVNFLNCLLF